MDKKRKKRENSEGKDFSDCFTLSPSSGKKQHFNTFVNLTQLCLVKRGNKQTRRAILNQHESCSADFFRGGEVTGLHWLLEKRKRCRAAPLWVKETLLWRVRATFSAISFKNTRPQLVQTHANTHAGTQTHSLHTTIRRKMMTRASRDAVGSSAKSSCQVTPHKWVCGTAL